MSWEAPRCLRHRSAAAGFRCDGCGAQLCPACVARLRRGEERLDVCLLCGALARPIVERRALVHPFRRALLDAAAPSLATGGARTALLLVAAGALLRRLGAELASDLLPLSAYLLLLARRWAPPSRLRAAALRARLLGADLALLAGFWLLAGLALAGAGDLLSLAGAGPRSALGAAGRALAATALAAACARAVDLLLRTRGDELGVGPAADFLEPVLPDSAPRGRLASGEAALARERYGPFEADPDAPAAPAGPRGGSADARPLGAGDPEDFGIRWDEAPGGVPREYLELPPVPGASAPHALALALAARDFDRAVAVFAEALEEALPPLTLSAQAWWALAQACLARDRALLAVRGFERVAAVAPAGPLAPQALLQAARARDERLGDREGSDAQLAALARGYPESAEGRFAGKRLSASARA